MADNNKKKSDEKRATSETERARSVSQADGTAAQDQPGETQAQPNSANAETSRVNRQPSQNRTGQINPSAPTEGTEGGLVTEHLVGSGPSTMDNAGEVGHPSGKGTLEVDEQRVTTAPRTTKSKRRSGSESKAKKKGQGDEEAA
jgi:hypothetical protein